MDSVSADVGFSYILFSFQGFSQEFVENSVRVLVTRFLPLNASDLENWMSDPEEWVSTEEKENARWEFEIRVCICIFPVLMKLTTFERHALNTSSCN
jgi:antibiotic biosynthesis monooxygenase (ABM) superfamily enzyme